jgi:CBS domain-containing protein
MNISNTARPRSTLSRKSAADLMTPNPVSIRDDATVHEAVAMLTDRGFSAAPVIDKAGRAVGVVSRADIVVHDRELGHSSARDYFTNEEVISEAEEKCPPGSHIEKPDGMLVRDIMTPMVFAVSPSASARRVVSDMVGLKVHRLFVVDRDGVLVGIISSLDVLKHIWPAKAAAETLALAGA